MVATQTLRNWYPELVKHGVDGTWNITGGLYCDYSSCKWVSFYAAGSSYPTGSVSLKVHPATEEAFKALAAVFRNFGYAFREAAGGTAVCRRITGGRKTSPHAHGIALDINPSKNRYIHTTLRGLIQWGKQTDMPEAMIDAVKAIKTTQGIRVFGWGGDWSNIKDPMHFQVEISQQDLSKGIDWSTVTDNINTEEEMVLKNGDKGNAVRLFQVCLNNQGSGQGLDPDGIFGDLTEAAVKRYQTAAQMTVTGEIDGVTASLLVRYEEE